jgi:glycine/D-amino acid oxidase-like deaminating enzyme
VPRAIVVGAGVFGASLAHRLAGEAWDVVLVDPHESGHARAASGGESRLLRCSHGDDVPYTRSARRARTLWRELEAEADEELLVECGVVWLARRFEGWEAASERTLGDAGIPCERVDPHDLFPSVAAEDLSWALLEPEAGLLRAAAATRALARCAEARGVQRVSGAGRPDGDRVRLDDGTLEGDAVVWASGAWLPSLFPGVLDVRVTRQDVLFFGAPGPGWGAGDVPGWVDYEGAMYGCGDLDGWGVKVAPDTEGPDFHPDDDRRAPRPEADAAAREYLRGRFPALAGAPLVGARACQYVITPDTHFVAARHPDHRSVWLVGGDSGHGFKHGPALAERLAPMLAGDEAPDPRFALGPRTRDRSLRTAGGTA